jgi:hypothetical protein
VGKAIKILLTFDYELPLGGTKDYNHDLFEPAARLIDEATALKVPIVLFADVCSAIRFRDWDYNGFFLPFSDQIQKSIGAGHDVQLHIHPHWMTSGFADGSYTPSPDFSLSNFATEKNGHSIESIIELAFKELSAMCRAADRSYECVAFRAGGYDVEPESARILTALNKLGVRIDSSLIKEFYLDYTYSKIDYTNSPRPSKWFVSEKGPLTKQVSSGLLELPITSMPVSVTDVLTRRGRKIINSAKYKARVYNNSGRGFLTTHGSQDLSAKLRKIVNPVMLSLDKEYFECKDLMRIVDYNVGQYRNENEDLVLTAIGHPKSMGAYHVGLMKEFVLALRERFQDDLSFVTYRDIKRNLLNNAEAH